MTREEAKSRAELYSALAEGKTIQVLSCKGEWIDIKTDELDYLKNYYKYRIKPEPKYRPFKTQEECWNEMLKHQPFGWIKSPHGELFCIDKVFEKGIEHKNSRYKFDVYLECQYLFIDGTPFGIKEK